MDLELEDLVDRLRKLEEEFERKLDARGAAFRYRLRDGRVEFERSVIEEHRRIRTGMIRFLRGSTAGALLIAPFVYGLIVPLVALDVAVWLYQRTCFPVWGIEPVSRGRYIVLDRRHLGYLNAIEKLNCEYCGYANGLIAYVREVASRTEQYWCPIKHALRAQSAHPRYRTYVDYGDAEGFRARLQEFRDALRKSGDAG